MLRVIAYTGGAAAPSGRYRVEQYLPYMQKENIDLTVRRSRAGAFPPKASTSKRMSWAVRNLVEHAPSVLKSRNYDLVLFQRELFSSAVTFEPLTRRPRVFDVDDAVWTLGREGFARRMVQACDHVICGNHFLAEHFSRWNSHVSILPTPVDTRRWRPAQGLHSERPVIGWLGLSYGFRYLHLIEPALKEVLLRHPAACLKIISDRSPSLQTLSRDQVEYVSFSSLPEEVHFQRMTIGIMPLDDSVIACGKCSFKMLQYMACGIPVVVTPIAMNAEVLQKARVGFGAETLDEWVECLDRLLQDPGLRESMGQAGRGVVEEHYSVEVLAPKLGAILRRVCDASKEVSRSAHSSALGRASKCDQHP